MPDEFEKASLRKPELVDNKFLTPGLQVGTPPEQFRLPSHTDMVSLARTPEGQARLAGILEHYGITDPIEISKARAIAASQRLQKVPPGSPLYDQMERDIVERYANQELMGMTRKATEQYSSLIAIEGNPNTEMILISEDDISTCDMCAAYAGTINTWAEWQVIGLPGNS